MNILLRRKGMVSGKTLAQALEIRDCRSDRVIPGDVDTVIRWGCTTGVECQREINTAVAISRISAKNTFRKILEPEGLCPPTWHKWEEVPDEACPVVVRPAVHSKGRDFYYCPEPENIPEATRHFVSYYITKFIEKEAEYRAFVAQGKVVWMARKFPAREDDKIWNVENGGHFENVRWKEWPASVCDYAIRACKLAELDFGAVDLITKGKDAYVLEINSAPALTTPYRTECTITTLKWMLEGKEVEDNPERRGYGRYIHPAVEK